MSYGLSVNQFHVVTEGDFLLFVELAEGLLEVLLTAVERLVDVLGAGLVGDGHFTTMGPEVLLDAVGEIVNTHLLDFGQRDIHLAVGAHLLDKGGEAVTDENLEQELLNYCEKHRLPSLIGEYDFSAKKDDRYKPSGEKEIRSYEKYGSEYSRLFLYSVYTAVKEGYIITTE